MTVVVVADTTRFEQGLRQAQQHLPTQVDAVTEAWPRR
jgi:hypothetical protein